MKIYLVYNIIDEPYGGANQFLKSLKKELEKQGTFAPTPDEADAFIFNSHTLGGNKGNGPATITRLKYRFPDAIFIHRVDGPVSMYRGDESQLYVDQIIYELNSTLADGTLYQSEWSRRANLDLGKKPTLFTQTVLNAPDCDIFYPAKYTKNLTNQKVKIIASSFSNHPNKGFATYHWLDQNLDFSRFEITFVGNTPTQFQNIKHIPAVKPSELADLLRDNDIYVTASQKDPCSNALIEALHCGLPAIALRDGGHPEIVGAAGELFDTAEEIPDLLTRIASNYEQYSDRTHLPDIAEAAEQYQAFIGRIIEEVKTEKYQPKKLSLIGFLYRYNYYRISLLLRILKSRIINLFKANK